MTDYHVGPLQTYLTIQAAWTAMPAGVWADSHRMIIHAATYTEMLDLSTKHPTMSDANRLIITVNSTDTVVWNNGADNYCIYEDLGSNLYLTIDEGSGSLTIEGSTDGWATISLEWLRDLTVNGCVIKGENTAGTDGIYVPGGGEAYNATIQFDGLELQAPQGQGFYIRGDDADYGLEGTVANCLVTNCGESGFALRTHPKALAFDDNEFTGLSAAGSHGIRMWNNQNGATELYVRGSHVHGNAGTGGFLTRGFNAGTARQDVVISGTRFYNNGAAFEFIGDEGTGGECHYGVQYNTLDGEGTMTSRFIRMNGTASSDWQIRDNILHDCDAAGGAIDTHGSFSGGYVIDYNCFHNNAKDVEDGLTVGGWNIYVDPLFVNEAGDDYTIDPESPCVEPAGLEIVTGWKDIGWDQTQERGRHMTLARIW